MAEGKTERKNLTITQVEEIKKVGDKQIPKLSFRAREGNNELAAIYFTFKPSLFELIKEGQTISADIEIEQRGEYTNRKVVQIYLDGQPVSSKGTGRSYGKSPEELEQTARLMILAYAKDLAVADKIPLKDIPKTADWFYTWLKVSDKVASPTQPVQKDSGTQESEDLFSETPPTGLKVQNIAELKSLMMKHKIGTHEAYEILSIKGFLELTDLDEAWAKIKEAKGLE